jgi:hypothetical protein
VSRGTSDASAGARTVIVIAPAITAAITTAMSTRA